MAGSTTCGSAPAPSSPSTHARREVALDDLVHLGRVLEARAELEPRHARVLVEVVHVHPPLEVAPLHLERPVVDAVRLELREPVEHLEIERLLARVLEARTPHEPRVVRVGQREVRHLGLEAERVVLVDDVHLVHADRHVTLDRVLRDRAERLVQRRLAAAALGLDERAEARELRLLVRAARRLELRDRPVLVALPERGDRLAAVHVERPQRHAVLAVHARQERREGLGAVVVRHHVPAHLVEGRGRLRAQRRRGRARAARPLGEHRDGTDHNQQRRGRRADADLTKCATALVHHEILFLCELRRFQRARQRGGGRETWPSECAIWSLAGLGISQKIRLRARGDGYFRASAAPLLITPYCTRSVGSCMFKV